MRFKLVLPAIAVFVLVMGCGHKKPTQKQLAQKHWNQTRAGVLLSLAKDQYATGNFEKCRKTVSEAMALDPESASLRILSARLAMEQSQLETADAELALARKYDPKNAEADYLSGVIYQRWQKPEQARQFYSDAFSKNPDELAYLMAMSEMLVVMDRVPEALSALQEHAQTFEHSAILRDATGQLLTQLGRHHEAVDILRQASVLATDDLSIREHLAFALFNDRQYREAGEAFKRLTGSAPYKERADIYLAIGECHMQGGRLREARASFEKASQLEPGSSAVWLSLAKASLELEDIKRVELSIQKASSLDPASSDTQLLLGYLRLRQNRLNDALVAFQKASALDGANTVSLCMTGYVMERLGRGSDAIGYYGQALKVKPDDEMAAKMMASVDASGLTD
jgi:tetratricopeptide (TPR) repeat protein